MNFFFVWFCLALILKAQGAGIDTYVIVIPAILWCLSLVMYMKFGNIGVKNEVKRSISS